MAQTDLLKRFLDAGIAFTQMTQRRAEEIVRDLVRAGEVQTEQAQSVAEDLLQRSRENSERLVGMVRDELRNSISSLGLASRDDIARLERRIDALAGSGGAGPSPVADAEAPPPGTAARKAGGRKAAAKKSPAKRTAKKSPAKRATPPGTVES